MCYRAALASYGVGSSTLGAFRGFRALAEKIDGGGVQVFAGMVKDLIAQLSRARCEPRYWPTRVRY